MVLRFSYEFFLTCQKKLGQAKDNKLGIYYFSAKHAWFWFDLLCLTPLSAIFHIYHGDLFLVVEEARREPTTMGKQLVNFSLAAASRVHLLL
jgi:hypothetical protein